MANPYKQFLDLIPGPVRLVGEVLGHNADGTSSIALPEGDVIRARGIDVAAGRKAFVLNGKVDGPAPDYSGLVGFEI
jgi:hypothetical protein